MKVKLRGAPVLRASRGAAKRVLARLGSTRNELVEVQHGTIIILEGNALVRMVLEHGYTVLVEMTCTLRKLSCVKNHVVKVGRARCEMRRESLAADNLHG